MTLSRESINQLKDKIEHDLCFSLRRCHYCGGRARVWLDGNVGCARCGEFRATVFGWNNARFESTKEMSK